MGILRETWDALTHGVENMAKNEQKHALYLQDQDGHIALFPADQVDDKLAAGYIQPLVVRPNGYAYNREEDLYTNDAQATVQAENADIAAKKAAKDEKDAEAVRKASEDAAKANEDAKAWQTAQPVKVIDPPSD